LNPLYAGADLVSLFKGVLGLCKVHTSETVLIVTDAQFKYYMYPPAAFAAAHSLGANAYIMLRQADQDLEDKVSTAAWSNADLVIGMFSLPVAYSWLYTDFHSSILASGTRVLAVHEPLDRLKRMPPTKEIMRRGLAGAKLLEPALKIRVVSKAGTDLTFRKDGRKGSYQCGVADSPGRWDHWPSGMVYCAPLEDSAEGLLVVQPGDILLGSLRYATTRCELLFKKGRITKISGGLDARYLEEYLTRKGDENSLRLAHAGWGTDHRADWRYIGMDSESFYGNITIALGRNIFDSPAPHCGMGGSNRSRTHFDISLRETSLYLDDQVIVKDGRFILKELV